MGDDGMNFAAQLPVMQLNKTNEQFAARVTAFLKPLSLTCYFCLW